MPCGSNAAVGDRTCRSQRTECSHGYFQHRLSMPEGAKALKLLAFVLLLGAVYLWASSKTGKRLPSATAGSDGLRVLYVMRSWHANYGTRLEGVLSTWGKDVLESRLDRLIIVGDQESESPPVVAATMCGNDHSRELCCKTGFALQLAYNLSEFHWVFVVDDDLYLNNTNAKHALAGYNASQPVALGIPGCGPQFCH